jgi:hypothetical protein
VQIVENWSLKERHSLGMADKTFHQLFLLRTPWEHSSNAQEFALVSPNLQRTCWKRTPEAHWWASKTTPLRAVMASVQLRCKEQGTGWRGGPGLKAERSRFKTVGEPLWVWVSPLIRKISWNLHRIVSKLNKCKVWYICSCKHGGNCAFTGNC